MLLTLVLLGQLIVDDDIKHCQLLANKLLKLDYRVYLAFNSKDALKSLNENKPDIVLLDLLLPKLEGHELLLKIRENSQIPIIIVTALKTLSDQIIGLRLGADDYITKPFSLYELVTRIQVVLNS